MLAEREPRSRSRLVGLWSTLSGSPKMEGPFACHDDEWRFVGTPTSGQLVSDDTWNRKLRIVGGERFVCAQYVGSFRVEGGSQASRAQHVRGQLINFQKSGGRTEPVLLVISLSGIKVCSQSGQMVHMAHSLKRISYATCDPQNCQFSFLAREPQSASGHPAAQFCHAFRTRLAQEAEELNLITGNAFKMAYAYLRHKKPATGELPDPATGGLPDPATGEPPDPATGEPPDPATGEPPDPATGEPPDPATGEPPDPATGCPSADLDLTSWQGSLERKLRVIGTANVNKRVEERKARRRIQEAELERKKQEQRIQEAELERKKQEQLMQGKDRTRWAKQIAGKTKHRMPYVDEASLVAGSPSLRMMRDLLDDANDLHLHHRSPITALKDCIDQHFTAYAAEEKTIFTAEEKTALQLARREEAPAKTIGNVVSFLERPLPDTPLQCSAASAAVVHRNKKKSGKSTSPGSRLSWILGGRNAAVVAEKSASRSSPANSTVQHQCSSAQYQSSAVQYQNSSPVHCLGGSQAENTEQSATGPPTPLRNDSLQVTLTKDEDTRLQHAPWYQTGLPREIALELLAQQDIGAFIIRDSSTHHGCYALSVKVPKYDNPSGISHYLIMRTTKGTYKLKGLEKDWPNLHSLVTHHTVMPEMLPCTLHLPEHAENPTFLDNDNHEPLFDSDYNQLTDCTAMMANLQS